MTMMLNRFTYLLLTIALPAAAQRHAAIVTLPQRTLAARTAAAGAANAPLTGSGHWLLIYLSADQPLDAQTSHFIARLHADNPQARIAVLIDRPRELAAQYVHDHPAAAIHEWWPDADHFYRTGLALTGSPVLMGMEDDRVIWRDNRLLVQNRPLIAQIAEWLLPPVAEAATPVANAARPRPAAPAAPRPDSPGPNLQRPDPPRPRDPRDPR